jgi:NTE family protein
MSEKKGLVVGGGGARGAWAVGALHYLLHDLNERYQVVAGTSTGSLIAPLAALGKYDELKTSYTTTSADEILGTRLPWRGDKSNAIWALITGKDSVYTSTPLYETLLKKHLKQEYWDELVDPATTVEVWICAVDLISGKKRYFSPRDPGMTREIFARAIVASCTIPVLMSRARIPGELSWFVDGGCRDIVPLGHVIRQGADEIRVITMGTDPLATPGEYGTLDQVLLRTLELFEEETSDNDISTGSLITLELDWRDRLREKLRGTFAPSLVDQAFAEVSAQREPMQTECGHYVPVTLKWLRPEVPIGPTHVFNEQQMLEYYMAGYKYAAAKDEWDKPEANWEVFPQPV